MTAFSDLDPMKPQDNNYVDVLLEMRVFDLKERKIKDTNDIKNAYKNASKSVNLDSKTDPMKPYKRMIKREDAFKHVVFGNNYRMFGIEKPFDIDELPWR